MLVLNQSEFIHLAPLFFSNLKKYLFIFVFKAYGIVVPQPGTEPISPALDGGFLTSTPPVVVQSLSHVPLCDLMNYNTPGFPVLHHLPEFAQTHVHRVGDAIQPSHPLSSPSPPALKNLSQDQSLCQ